jgi:GLPGLI family protein
MSKIITSFVLIFFLQSVIAQNDQGVITYERKMYWINVSSKLPWMTQAEIDRDKLTWGKRQGRWSETYDLSFTPTASLYKEKESEESMGYSRRDGNFLMLRDYKAKTVRDNLTLVDRDYLVEGDIPAFKWKILNEIREIQGFLCMKALTSDPVKDVPVYAWFTDQIPVPGGPEGYGGLPGMILALEIGPDGVFIEATKVDLESTAVISFPKKAKGKKVDVTEYQEKVKENIAKAIANKRNPFWYVRY